MTEHDAISWAIHHPRAGSYLRSALIHLEAEVLLTVAEAWLAALDGPTVTFTEHSCTMDWPGEGVYVLVKKEGSHG